MTLNELPAEYVTAFRELATFSDEEFSQIVSALEKVGRKSVRLEDIAAALSTAGVSTRAISVDKLAEAILSLHQSAATETIEKEDVAKEAAKHIIKSASGEETAFTSTQEELLTSRILGLFQISSLWLSTKATILSLQNERLFRKARLFTDIRPVFRGNSSVTEPEGAVLLHQLKVEYFSFSGDMGEFFITLDSEDLKQFTETLQRALEKARVLKNCTLNLRDTLVE